MKELKEGDLISIEKLCSSVQFDQWKPEEFIRKHCIAMINEIRRLKDVLSEKNNEKHDNINCNDCCEVKLNDCNNDSCCESNEQSCENDCNNCINCPCK